VTGTIDIVLIPIGNRPIDKLLAIDTTRLIELPIRIDISTYYHGGTYRGIPKPKSLDLLNPETD
jgi:hypothetical protein